MSRAALVFRVQFALFKREKGMLLFYLLCGAVVGIAVPLFYHSMEFIIPMAVFFPVIFLKPLLADSLAGERERETLESLLSAPIGGNRIIWGKTLFCWLFAAVFFILIIGFAVATFLVTGLEVNIAAWQWICVILAPILNFAAISLAGVYASAFSPDPYTANRKASRIAYPLGILLIAFLSIVFLAEPISILVTGLFFALVVSGVILVYSVKASRMRQADYFENVRIKKSSKAHDGAASLITPKSQFSIVFRHELRVLLTYRSLFLNPLGLITGCFAPAIVVCLLTCLTRTIDLNYAVLVTLLLIPRTPMNLAAISIGGEKAYKTGESLLATPLRVRPVFLAKSMLAIVFSAITLVVSALLTLGVAYLAGKLLGMPGSYTYSGGQAVLLFLAGIMSGVTMVFITGVLSVNLKTPRQGLYMASILSFAFILPPLAIIYLTHHALIWAIVYSAVLAIGNAMCVKSISDRIERPLIMSKL